MSETNACPKCGAALPGDAPDGICPKCLLLAGLGSDVNSTPAAALAPTTPQSGAFVPLEPATLAAHFPQLEIMELIGHGGMGAVYQARQKKLDRLVALKIIRPEAADDPAFAERFNREARTLARLSHPHIVGVHDFGELSTQFATAEGEASAQPHDSASSQPESPTADGVLYYFLMEYVDGVNLRQLMESQNLSAGQALAIISQICDGLQFAHDGGVVHRDIKPENILVDSRGRVKIADFGLAKLAEHSEYNFTLTGTHQVMGTPQYMAPEQMGGSRSVDHRADIYSLGVVFYELLTGEVPMGQFEPPSKKAAVDARLDSVVLRALAREPERRFQSAGELRSDVDAISSVDVTPIIESRGVSVAAPRPGVSTIMEREAVAAWRWVAGGADLQAPDSRPELPTLLMILLSVCGCLTVLLPWIDVEILETTPGDSAEFAEFPARTDNGYSLCFWQDNAAADAAAWAGGDFGRNITIKERQHTFHGLDQWPGVTVCVTFGLFTLLLIALPPGHRRMIRWCLLMTLLAGLALLHTFLFRLEVNSSLVRIPPGRGELSDGSQRDLLSSASNKDSEPADISTPQHHFVLFQDMSYSDSPQRLRGLKHRLIYRPGFFSAVGLSIVLLVLSATGIRHAGAHGARQVSGSERTGSLLKADAMASPETQGEQTHISAPASEGDTESVSVANAGARPLLAEGGRRESGLLWQESEALDEVQAVVDGPAMAFIVVGLLAVVGLIVAMIVMAVDPAAHLDDVWFYLLGGIVLGSLVAWGGWSMRGLRSSGMSMTGAILALVPTPALLLTLPLGIWAIRVLNRPDVRNAFIVRARQRKWEAEHSVEPRFSRKALFGACLVPVFLIAGLAVLIPTTTKVQSNSGVVLSNVPYFLLLCMILPVCVGPFLTTILGIMAVSEIRHSQGRLIGLGLAFIDAVFYPVLVIDAVILGAAWMSLHDGHPSPVWEAGIAFGVLALLIGNVVVLRSMWKKLQLVQ